jgi:hypothetical protein
MHTCLYVMYNASLVLLYHLHNISALVMPITVVVVFVIVVFTIIERSISRIQHLYY